MSAGRTAVRETRFHNPRLTRVGVDVLSVDRLRAYSPKTLGQPERLEFHLLMLVEAGRSRHQVDFLDLNLRPGTVVFVRPGQVQQWFLKEELRAELVLISAEALAPSIARAEIDMKLLALPEWPAVSVPSRTLFREVAADVRRMRKDIERFEGGEIDAAIIRHAVLALLLRLARELRANQARAVATREAEIHRLFAHELESGFHKRLTVLDYARRLGYSESTLSRACVATIGRTAKQAIDLRVVLEAKRLLVHSDSTVVGIGHQLGFAEPTNFVKFFRRLEGMTPLEFRARALGV
jgi:AraC-like DNA-binding protein